MQFINNAKEVIDNGKHKNGFEHKRFYFRKHGIKVGDGLNRLIFDEMQQQLCFKRLIQ